MLNLTPGEAKLIELAILARMDSVDADNRDWETCRLILRKLREQKFRDRHPGYYKRAEMRKRAKEKQFRIKHGVKEVA